MFPLWMVIYMYSIKLLVLTIRTSSDKVSTEQLKTIINFCHDASQTKGHKSK